MEQHLSYLEKNEVAFYGRSYTRTHKMSKDGRPLTSLRISHCKEQRFLTYKHTSALTSGTTTITHCLRQVCVFRVSKSCQDGKITFPTSDLFPHKALIVMFVHWCVNQILFCEICIYHKIVRKTKDVKPDLTGVFTI